MTVSYEGRVQKLLATSDMTAGDVMVKVATHFGIAPSSLCIQASASRLVTPEESVRALLSQGIEHLCLIDRLKALKECEAVDLQVTIGDDGIPLVMAGTVPRLIDYLLNAKAASTQSHQTRSARESACACE